MGLLKKMQLTASVGMACIALVACNSAQKEENQGQQQAGEQQTEQQKKAGKLSQQDLGDIDIARLSEALGHFIGRNLKSPTVPFDVDKIVQGIQEGAEGKPSPMTDEEYEAAMAQLQRKVYEHLSETNMADAEKFLSENAQAPGVVEIVPGKLQYLILEEGRGPAVPEHGTPSISYTGKYLDGTVFGSSENSGGPISVPIDQTIAGFSQGIAGMKEGEKRRLFVHPDFGYGKGGQLPPNTLLIFDIEVVKAAPASETTTSEAENEAADDQDVFGNEGETGATASKDNN
jgi:peptidylprolyl isomerase